ncbi:MAG: hypothetical protein H6597_02985 [Flavobacteriales bacterium]|nr:hypothetical protein [Flavobacteriales bacterium]MCB9193471.1 hypothetical protein [Flavobacteriales bacterium]
MAPLGGAIFIPGPLLSADPPFLVHLKAGAQWSSNFSFGPRTTAGRMQMADRSHDHVHRLIRAMSPAEKRYFKLFTSRHMIGGKSNYQLLFDAIAAMEYYDEASLLKKFRDQAFTRRFAITKRRLYEALLNSLSAFHAERSIDARLHRLLHQVEVLYEKALYTDAAKLLRTAGRMARQHERAHAVLEAQQWQRRLTERGNYGHVGPKDLDRMEAEAAAMREDLATIDALWNAKSRVFLQLYRQGPVRDEDGTQDITRFLDFPEAHHPDRIRTVQGRFLLHHLHSAVAFATGDLQTCHTHLMANRELLIAERERTIDTPHLALSVISNLTYVCMRLGRFEEGMRMLQEFRRIPAKLDLPETEDLDLRLFSTSMSLETALYARAGEFDKAIELLPIIERGMARFGDRLGPLRRAGFLYQIAYCHYGAGQHGTALRWCHRLMNELRSDAGAELAGSGRMLESILLLELDDRRTLQYVLRNTERALRTDKGRHRAEEIALRGIREVLRARDQKERQTAYARTAEALSVLETDPLEQVAFEHFDLIAWALSGRTGRPFAEVVKERLARAGLAA